MNAPVRIAHLLLKAMTTATAHEAKKTGMASINSANAFANVGLLNTSFNYADFMTHGGDEPIAERNLLTFPQIKYITQGHNFNNEFISKLYQIALKLVEMQILLLDNNYIRIAEAKQEEVVSELEIVVSKPELSNVSILELKSIPKFIAKDFIEQGINTIADLVSFSKEQLVEKVRDIGGGSFHTKKVVNWLEEAQSYENSGV